MLLVVGRAERVAGKIEQSIRHAAAAVVTVAGSRRTNITTLSAAAHGHSVYPSASAIGGPGRRGCPRCRRASASACVLMHSERERQEKHIWFGASGTGDARAAMSARNTLEPPRRDE